MRSARTARSLSGPQLGWACRNSRIARTASPDRRCGTVRGACERSARPADRICCVSTRPLVARLAADPEPVAQRASRLAALEPRRHELHPLVHCTGFLPTHRRSSRRQLKRCHPSSRSKLLPIYPVCTVPTPLPPRASAGPLPLPTRMTRAERAVIPPPPSGRRSGRSRPARSGLVSAICAAFFGGFRRHRLFSPACLPAGPRRWPVRAARAQ